MVWAARNAGAHHRINNNSAMPAFQGGQSPWFHSYMERFEDSNRKNVEFASVLRRPRHQTSPTYLSIFAILRTHVITTRGSNVKKPVHLSLLSLIWKRLRVELRWLCSALTLRARLLCCTSCTSEKCLAQSPQ